MTVTNMQHDCSVKVTCVATDFPNQTGINKVQVYRSDNAGLPELIGEIGIASHLDLNFTFYDHFAVTGHEYVYRCIPMIGNTQLIGCSGSVKCFYQNLFIGNVNEQYIGALNVEYSHRTNFNRNYAQTYYAAYPHAITNGSAEYETGNVSALFLDLDKTTCRFDIAGAGEYKRKLKHFLADKTPKVIKTREGDIWTVQINGNVEEAFSQAYGASIISFEWTQIDDAPVGVVLEQD